MFRCIFRLFQHHLLCFPVLPVNDDWSQQVRRHILDTAIRYRDERIDIKVFLLLDFQLSIS